MDRTLPYNWYKHSRNPYVKSIKRMLYLGQINWDDYHMELGRHFKYPMCCIKNFIKHRRKKVAEYMDNKYGWDSVRGYVRCKNHRKGVKYEKDNVI
ncbi:hypothetical protein LCGC14_0458540 [marine sediment metagenome]|uniref:Uncharacterized protein n=1 Tax=marine sediment metagenome TaxID=412755 RepID=A0A0F9VPI8_9ZZZZ